MRRIGIAPFIGITDFTSAEQVQKILSIREELNVERETKHLLGVGVMMSYKTLHGLPTKWIIAFPPKEQIADIFIDNPHVFNVLHYADYENLTTTSDLFTAISLCERNIHAIQLDMVWPSIRLVQSALRPKRYRRKRVKIILQVGRKAMELLDNDLENVVEKILEYYLEGCLDYVLLDKSGGEGREMDSELLVKYYKEIRKYVTKDQLGIIAAGGLGPLTTNLLDPFKREGLSEDLSIDAQGRLRPSKNAIDPVDWDMAAEYYRKSHTFFATS